jgi:hypothetical protein
MQQRTRILLAAVLAAASAGVAYCAPPPILDMDEQPIRATFTDRFEPIAPKCDVPGALTALAGAETVKCATANQVNLEAKGDRFQ